MARTDPDRPKHAGITYFLVALKSPGITVHPLKQISGQSEFNQVFLDNVRILSSSSVPVSFRLVTFPVRTASCGSIQTSLSRSGAS